MEKIASWRSVTENQQDGLYGYKKHNLKFQINQIGATKVHTDQIFH